MPFQSDNQSYRPSDDLPQHLDHKPVFAMPYEHFDGIYAGETDARYISVGLAQYDPYHVSIKTMRRSEKRWTRQAEELPLHRAIDMSIFLAKVLGAGDQAVLNFPAQTFQKQENDFSVSQENRSISELENYRMFLEKNMPMYKFQFKVLLDILKSLEGKGFFTEKTID